MPSAGAHYVVGWQGIARVGQGHVAQLRPRLHGTTRFPAPRGRRRQRGNVSSRYSAGMPTLSPLDVTLQRGVQVGGRGRSAEVESLGSKPAMCCRISAASATDRVSGPAWSSELANAMMPQREHRAVRGFEPDDPRRTTRAGGSDPPVSVPSAAGTACAATMAADPPELPPGTNDGPSAGLHGFRDRPPPTRLVGRAHRELVPCWSCLGVWPRRPHNLALTVDSYSGTNPSRIREPAVVATPPGTEDVLDPRRGCLPTGVPPSGGVAGPHAGAAAHAPLRGIRHHRVEVRGRASWAAMHASTSSTAEQSPAASQAAASATPSRLRSDATAIR